MTKKKKPAYKLYVWQNVLTDYTPGLLVVLAASDEHARQLVAENLGRIRGQVSEHAAMLFDGEVPEIVDLENIPGGKCWYVRGGS